MSACPFTEFCKACPASLRLTEYADGQQPYKYFACGKGCTLGVLFEDSAHVYFEWLTENDRLVGYPARLRYKFWPKREFARLLGAGVWDATTEPPFETAEAGTAPAFLDGVSVQADARVSAN